MVVTCTVVKEIKQTYHTQNDRQSLVVREWVKVMEKNKDSPPLPLLSCESELSVRENLDRKQQQQQKEHYNYCNYYVCAKLALSDMWSC